MTEAWLNKGNFNRALAACQKAIWNQSDDVDTNDIFFNPPIHKVRDKFGYLKTLKTKIKILQRLDSNAELLLPTFETCITAIELMDSLRSVYHSDASKTFLGSNGFPIFESAICTALKLYQNTEKKSYLKYAFSFAEKSKALLLLESSKILNNEEEALNTELSGIIKSGKLINSDLFFYERKLFEEQRKSTNANLLKIKNWEAKLKGLRSAAEKNRFHLETTFPDYYHLNHDLSVVSVEEIQDILLQSQRKKSAFIEYFLGDSALYIFFISKDIFQVFEFPDVDTLNQALSDILYLQSINPNSIRQDSLSLSSYQKYTQAAYLLYQQLLAPCLENKPVDQLIIVPDGQLGYLSFEALLKAPAASGLVNYSSSHLDYLIEDYEFSYANSGSLFLLNYNKKKSSAHRPYAGFAPVFKQGRSITSVERGCHNGQLGFLENSEKSVKAVREIFGGDLYMYEKATKNSFLNAAPSYRLLHLSTHACVDDDDPMFNKVYFADDYLATYELYKLRLNADLVVLSACETSKGELVRGGRHYEPGKRVYAGRLPINNYQPMECQ